MNLHSFLIGLIVEVFTPMAKIARNDEQSVLSVEVRGENFTILLRFFVVIYPYNDGNNANLISKDSVNVGHMHF